MTDFLRFYVGRWEWPSFNVADSAITVGVVLLAWDIWPRTSGRPASPRRASRAAPHRLASPFRRYGVLMALGFLAALWLLRKRAPAFGVAPDAASDIGIWLLLVGLAGREAPPRDRGMAALRLVLERPEGSSRGPAASSTAA